ncbi:MAG: nucleoside monophosphate kinase [Patescibacteria group bacterium]
MTEPQAYIFVGRSGAGKGTQAELLINHLKRSNPDRPVVGMETGRYFRELIKQPTYSGQLAKAVSDSGDLPSSFIPIHLWSNFLLNNLKGGEHLIFDGTPRSLIEAEALDTALNFYRYPKPLVILLDVSVERAKERLLSRQRHDDSEQGIAKRLAWYESDVVPAIKYYENRPNYRLVRIDGNQTVETIHDEIVKNGC